MSYDLPVVDVWPTIQGEGPYTGHPAVFIRLGQCSLRCTWCDTNFGDFAYHGVPWIVEQVERCREHSVGSLVVITGGEPYMYDLDRLIRALWGIDSAVQVETSGSVKPQGELWRDAETVVSPKTPKLQGEFACDSIIAWKYVVGLGDQGLPSGNTQVPSEPGCPSPPLNEAPVYLQPLDYTFAGVLDPEYSNQICRTHVADLCMRHGYNLSLQMHKILGLK